MVFEELRGFCSLRGMPLDDTQLEHFRRFHAALYERNAVMNLTRVSPEQCEHRHFIDSLLVAEFIPQSSSVLDIGAGPGFPAWPLACARPDLQVVALDSSGKMLSFLRSQPLPNLTVVQERAEDRPFREQFDAVTGRALAPLRIQLEVSALPCKIGGAVTPFRSPADSDLIRDGLPPALGLVLESVAERVLPVEGAMRLFPVYRKVRSCSGEVPRRWADIRCGPLR